MASAYIYGGKGELERFKKGADIINKNLPKFLLMFIFIFYIISKIDK